VVGMSAAAMDDQSMSQQVSAASPVSPLRPAPISQMYVYSAPASLLLQQQQQQQQHQHDVTKMKVASGNGKSNEHAKSNDQVATDQAREILRQAVVSAENAAAGGAVKVKGAGKGAVRYRECQKNHAAGIGGHAIDGCGEFMPGDDDGALVCAACACHRNFHRREVEGEVSCDCTLAPPRKLPKPTAFGASLVPAPLPPNHVTPLAAMSAPTDSDENPDDNHPGTTTTTTTTIVTSSALHGLSGLRSPSIKKRFRTKFSSDQKDHMCAFAEKLGWRIQKHDEAAVQDFCSSVGVKRHVLKVWMHNNKHTMGKKP
jgi:ZF-HD class homeobox domain-containing protein